jgi:predicted exporter
MRALFKAIVLLGLLVAAAVFVGNQLSLDYRIDAFLPKPADNQQALVVDQISAGPGGRLILAALSGDDREQLADHSRRLASLWRELDGVERVDNGEFELDPVSEARLMRARFVLLDQVDTLIEPEQLSQRLDDRIAELALAGRAAEPLVRRDPLGLLQELAGRLAPGQADQQFDGLWFDAAGERALLTVFSAAPAFDIDAQAELIDQLRARFDSLDGVERITLTLGGAPVIGADSASRSRSNAILLSSIGSVFLLLVLTWAWRSPALVVAGAIPLAAGVLAGLLVTALAFGQIHGLTLAFGFTLLGVVLDYPIHLFGHASDRRLQQAARNIAGPLLLGALSTLIAYLAIWQSSSPGLAQLGAFSGAGLAAAALTTLLLPALGLNPPSRAVPLGTRWPHLPWLPLLLGLAALAALVIQGEQRWSADLTRLSPVNPQLLATDIELRQAIGAGDVRHLMVVSAGDLEATLQATEQAVIDLRQARAQGLLAGWQAVTDLVPSQAEQARRRAAWPDAATLAQALAEADSRFQANAFEPFIDDRRRLETAPWLGPESWAGTALALRVDSLLSQGEAGWRSILIPQGLDQPAELADWLARRDSPAQLVDLRATSEAMVAAYRNDAGTSLGLALLLIVAVLWLRQRQLRLTALTLLPPLAAVICTAALFSHFDQGLTIVHLLGLLLAAGIGLDFSIFSRSLSRDRREQARTNRAIGLCLVSSGGVFLILGQSDIGLLRMLGLTVACGVLLSWLFARICQPPCRNY